METGLRSISATPPTSPAYINASAGINDLFDNIAVNQDEGIQGDVKQSEVSEQDPKITNYLQKSDAAVESVKEGNVSQPHSLDSHRLDKSSMHVDSADPASEMGPSLSIENREDIIDEARALENDRVEPEPLSEIHRPAGDLPDDGETEADSQTPRQPANDMKHTVQHLSGEADVKQALLREGAIIEKLSPKANRQIQDLIANVNTNKIIPSITVQKKILDKKYVTYIKQNPPTPLPRISRTTVQAFFTFLYLLTQRHWDPQILKRKMNFFMDVEKRLKYPSPIRHLTQKASFLSRFSRTMLDAAYEAWKERGEGEGEWVTPPRIEGYDPEHHSFEDIVVSFIGWNKREDRELQAFDKLMLLKSEEDKRDDDARIKAGNKVKPCSLKTRKFISLTADPPKLLERIKQLRTRLDEEMLEIEEQAKTQANCQEMENMTTEEWIEYHTYYIPLCSARGIPVGAKNVKPTKAIKPVITEAKCKVQATVVNESVPVASNTIELKDKEVPSPPTSEPPSCNPNTAQSIAGCATALQPPVLPNKKSKLRIVFVTKPGKVRVVKKKMNMSAEKKRKLYDDDDFIDDGGTGEYEEKPQKKRRLNKGRRGRKGGK